MCFFRCQLCKSLNIAIRRPSGLWEVFTKVASLTLRERMKNFPEVLVDA